MHLHYYPKPILMDEETGASGSGTIAIDPGAPFEHDNAPPAKDDKPPAESQEAKDIKALRAELADLRKGKDEAEEDARYWSRRAQEQRNATARETEDQPEPRRRQAEPAAEKPEKLIDELSTDGVAALKKRGIITADTLQEVLEEAEQRTDARISAARADAEFGMKLAQDYPEIAKDSERVDRGERPQSELFKRTGELYREAVAIDPSLKGSKGLLLLVAKQAKGELDAKAKPAAKEKAQVDDDEALPHTARRDRSERRDRIDAQRPERGRGSEESSGDPGFDRDQLAVMKHLGVKPEAFRKNMQTGGRRNGR